MNAKRVEIIGGPWPERIGLTGTVVPDPGNGVYPFDRPDLRGEIVIHIPNDPLRTPPGRFWTCVIRAVDVSPVPEPSEGEK